MAGIHAMMINIGTSGGSSIEGEIYLKPNGVTIAAQPTAKKGKWHSLDGKDYYVAVDYDDLVSIVSVYKGLTGAGEVLANLTRDGQTKAIPLNQVVTTFVDRLGTGTQTSGLFNNAVAFNQAIDSWDVGNVTNMSYTFSNCHAFNQDISDWNVSNVNYMEYMFFYCKAFNQDISSWCVSKIPSKPITFDYYTLSEWTTDKKPKWGVPC